jgi:heptosyltransferase-2
LAHLLTPVLGRMVRGESFAVPADIGDTSRVLAVDSGDLTEILFFSPVVGFLKNRFPGMRLSLLVKEGHGELVRGMPQVNEVISYEPPHLSLGSTTYFSLLKRIRRKRFDLVFLLGREFNLARAVLTLVSGARIRVGLEGAAGYPYLNCELRAAKEPRYRGEMARNFLTALGFAPEAVLPAWKLPEQDLRWAQRMIHFRSPGKRDLLVAVDPGVGKGRHRLVDDAVAYLVNRLPDRYRAKVMVLSQNASERMLAEFSGKLTVERVDVEPTNVRETLALLSCADLLISGNTDLFHFAVELRVPTLGLFTRHDGPEWVPKNIPWVQIVQVLRGQEISLDEFYSRVETLLHSAPRR